MVFYFGLNEDARSWVDDRAIASGCPLFLRNANDAYFLLENMASYNYHWYLSQYNAHEYKNPLVDIQKMLYKQGEIVREMHL